MSFHQHRFANGLEVVAETDPHALSAAVGFFVRAGARDEPPELAGVSHFLEHMAFKGSERRSADDVNRHFDDIGAKYNAYTSEEHTVFHAAVLPEYLPRAVDLLADLLRPSLRNADFELEKKVILEEIGMYADSPIWTAYERAMRTFFLDHPLGNSVLGTADSVGALTREAMCEYHRRRYGAANVLVAAAGKIDWNELCDLLERHTGSWSGEPAERPAQSSHRRGADEVLPRKEFVQECELLLVDGPSSTHRLRTAAEVLSCVIGDETGSRFYWSLVEPGRVDSVDFTYHEYEDAGAFLVSLSCQPDLAEENLVLVRSILEETMRHGVTPDELELAKNKLEARTVLAAERPSNRLFSIGSHWSYRRTYRSVDEELADLAAVDVYSIAELLREFPLLPASTVCLGPVDRLDGLRAVGAVPGGDPRFEGKGRGATTRSGGPGGGC